MNALRPLRLLALMGLATIFAASCAGDSGDEESNPDSGEDDLSQKPPQFVLLAFDGSKSNAFWAESRAFAKSVKTPDGKQAVHFTYFVNPSYYMPDSTKMRYCPPEHSSCGKSDIGFGGTEADVTARIEQTRLADLEGHEIGSHTVGHFDGSKWTEADWESEFQSFDKLFWTNADGSPRHGLDAIKAKGLSGFRAPVLGVSPGLFTTLAKHHFTYDTSKVNSTGYWPAKDAKTGLWNFPLADLVLVDSGKKTLSMDYNHFYTHTKGIETPSRKEEFKKDVLDTYMKYFETNKNGNRAPIHIGHHFSKWNGGAYWEAMQEFAKKVCVQTNVKCVTYREFAAWLETRTPGQLADYRKKSFEAGPEETYCDGEKPDACPHEDSSSHDDGVNDPAPVPPASYGSACTTNGDCIFPGSQAGFCYGYDKDAKGEILHGYCTQKCAGYCPGADTFCTAVEGYNNDVGFCSIKAGTTNNNCASFPNTAVTPVERYVGDSGVKPSAANVCLAK